MRNSKFLHFVSKLSRGELIIEDQKVRGPEPPSPPTVKLLFHPAVADRPATFPSSRQVVEGGEATGAGLSWAEQFQQDPRELPAQEAWARDFERQQQQQVGKGAMSKPGVQGDTSQLTDSRPAKYQKPL